MLVDVRKKTEAFHNKGKAHCMTCTQLQFGYYCKSKKASATHVDKPKHCKYYRKTKEGTTRQL